MQKYQILKDILSRKMITKYNINTRLKNYINIVKKSLVLAEKQIHELMKQKSHT